MNITTELDQLIAAHNGSCRDALNVTLAKLRQAQDEIALLKEERETDDICGFCGQPGADKLPHPMHWPTEDGAGSRYVHSECEAEETERAYRDFYRNVGSAGVKNYLSKIR